MKQTLKAPGKINLCLFLGARRGDGYHPLVSVVEPVSLADSLSVRLLKEGSGEDRVLCGSVDGPNLAQAALMLCREAGLDFPAVELTIEKRVPIAAGMGGGSADAAAALRLVAELAGEPLDWRFYRIAERLGADVPAQLEIGTKLVTGVGEHIEPVSSLGPHTFTVVPAGFGLSTADVYKEADRLGLGRTGEELAQLLSQVRAAFSPGSLPLALFVNDLQPAALSLEPRIEQTLKAVASVGADRVLVSGSGPTVVGVFSGPRSAEGAQTACEVLHHEGYSRAVTAGSLA